MEDECGYNIGGRIESDGHYATVHFVGEVPSTKGLWLGVEWDDPNRGKHDGSHNGVRYFTTKYPKSGSFVRPTKVNFGLSFVEALRDRYGLAADGHGGIVQEEMYVRGKGKQETFVEMVGAQSVNIQQSQLSQLQTIVLRGARVSTAGPDGEVGHTAPSISELNLSKNLLASWDDVARLAAQLGRLQSLNLSENRLLLPSSAEVMAYSFTKLHTLYLNHVGYNWTELLKCIGQISGLQQLHVCFNDISSMVDPSPSLQRLRLLNLEGNPVRDWKHILAIAKLPMLQTLILNDIGLESIYFPDCPPDGTTVLFPSLSAISLSHNNIQDWKSMNELNKLQQLRDVKLRRNPITRLDKDQTEEDVRQLIIAKIKRLQVCNITLVTSEDRKGSELDYLKRFGQQWKKSGGNQDPALNHPSAQFLAAHPRYQELVDYYGPAEDSELVKKSSALKSSLLNVKIECPLRPEKPPLAKKLPATMTVQKLRAMLQRLYKADPSTMKLTYTSKKMEKQEIEFENDMREIGFYAIESDDVIHVKW